MHAALILLGLAACLAPDLPSLGYHALPGWLALALGIACSFAFRAPLPARLKAQTPRLLATSVIGLGASVSLAEVARVGSAGFVYTLAGITFALVAGATLGRFLRVRSSAALLIAVGTAICGGSAIAAAAPVLRAEEEDVSIALGTVFLLNAIALALFPVLGHAFHLGQRSFGLWAALAIHDTSSVVGAATAYGPEATTVATITKLARALWIVPVTMAMVWVVPDEAPPSTRAKVKAKRPWFILGFLLVAALVTFVPSLRGPGIVVAGVARRSLVATLFLVGAGVSPAALKRVGARPLVLGALLWLVVASATLFAIVRGWIA